MSQIKSKTKSGIRSLSSLRWVMKAQEDDLPGGASTGSAPPSAGGAPPADTSPSSMKVPIDQTPAEGEPAVDVWNEFLNDRDEFLDDPDETTFEEQTDAQQVERSLPTESKKGEPAQPAESAPVVPPTDTPAEPSLPTAGPPPEAAPPAPPSQPTAEAAQPAVPEVPQLTPEQVREARDNLLQQMAAGYALSQEDADAMVTEPEKVLPKLAAQVELGAFERAFNAIVQNLPGLISAVIAQQTQKAQTESAFFSRWPALKGREKDIEGIAQIYRSRNASVSEAQAIEEIGKLAHAVLSIPLPAEAQAANGQDAQPSIGPPRPAQPSSSANPAQGRKPSANMWEQLNSEFDSEEI